MKISILKNAVSAKDFVCSATKGTKALVGNPRVAMVFTLLFVFTLGMFAQNTAGDYSAGTTALGTVTKENAFWLNHTQTKYDKMNIRLKKTRYK